VRAKEWTNVLLARLVAARADAVVAITRAIGDEMRSLNPSVRVETIPNGADFSEFAGLEYTAGDRFRITHAGSFFGRRTPRPFLEAFGRFGDDVVARFVGDFRASDRAEASALGLGDRLELVPFQTRSRTLRLERDTEALLLLLPDLGERGLEIPSGKVFEYLAARRPILAAVPTGGAAARLVREAKAGVVVPPDDPDAIAEALATLVARWRAGTLELPPLDDAVRSRVDRRARNADFAALLQELGAVGRAGPS
jgi:glycosyltransferase involved in cell wall biosynthesis